MRGGLPAQRVRLLLGADALRAVPCVAFYDECEARIRFDTNDCAQREHLPSAVCAKVQRDVPTTRRRAKAIAQYQQCQCSMYQAEDEPSAVSSSASRRRRRALTVLTVYYCNHHDEHKDSADHSERNYDGFLLVLRWE